jgi:hypothetical protein
MGELRCGMARLQKDMRIGRLEVKWWSLAKAEAHLDETTRRANARTEILKYIGRLLGVLEECQMLLDPFYVGPKPDQADVVVRLKAVTNRTLTEPYYIGEKNDKKTT